MPSLHQVCIPCVEWEGDGCLPDTTEDFKERVDTTGSPNVYFITQCSGTNEKESSLSGLSFYPNPTNTLLTIDAEQQDHYSININSLNGQLIYSTKMEGTTHQLDLSSFQKGVYFITIRSKDFVTTEKIIKL